MSVVIALVYFLAVVVGPVFWLWMLIDCVRRDFKDKIVWILVLIFLFVLGAVLYYFIVYRKYKRIEQTQTKEEVVIGGGENGKN